MSKSIREFELTRAELERAHAAASAQGCSMGALVRAALARLRDLEASGDLRAYDMGERIDPENTARTSVLLSRREIEVLRGAAREHKTTMTHVLRCAVVSALEALPEDEDRYATLDGRPTLRMVASPWRRS